MACKHPASDVNILPVYAVDKDFLSMLLDVLDLLLRYKRFPSTMAVKQEQVALAASLSTESLASVQPKDDVKSVYFC